MRLKIQRSQREAGLLSKEVIFCIDARVEITPEERQSIIRYKLYDQVIYNSEAQKRLLDRSAAHQDGSVTGGLKSLAILAVAALKMNITIKSLERGQHIECKSMDELIGAEDVIFTACQNMLEYLDRAQTFDGREILVSFSPNAAPIAVESAPQPALAMPDAMPLAEPSLPPLAFGPASSVAEPELPPIAFTPSQPALAFSAPAPAYEAPVPAVDAYYDTGYETPEGGWRSFIAPDAAEFIDRTLQHPEKAAIIMVLVVFGLILFVKMFGG